MPLLFVPTVAIKVASDVSYEVSTIIYLVHHKYLVPRIEECLH